MEQGPPRPRDLCSRRGAAALPAPADPRILRDKRADPSPAGLKLWHVRQLTRALTYSECALTSVSAWRDATWKAGWRSGQATGSGARMTRLRDQSGLSKLTGGDPLPDRLLAGGRGREQWPCPATRPS